MVTENEVLDVLKQCKDPEIPINIVDLGLIYDVAIQDSQVNVKMTLTTRGCHMSTIIADDAKQRLLELPNVQDVNVEIVWDPPWNPDMISPEGRKILGLPVNQ
jgi:metal-sulfur cluster biosynthetic enzyme